MCTLMDYRVTKTGHNDYPPRTEVQAVVIICNDPRCPLSKEVHMQGFRQGMLRSEISPNMFESKDKLKD